jgi:glutamyl-tRNA reductase
VSLILVGLSHRTAPVEVREQLNATEREAPEVLQALMSIPGVSGASLLSTCNRVETIISAQSEDVIELVVGTLATRASGMTREEIEKHLYVLRHSDVVRHLFRVTSGLDSMIVGEPQIAGQVRSAFLEAQQAGTLDSTLQQLFEQTMRVAKRVRHETGIGEHAVSVPYAAVELAKKIFGNLSGLKVLLVGAGEVGELTAEHLGSFGLERVFVANRAFDRAQQLAERFHGEAVHFDALPAHLESCDIVITSTAAPHFVITRDEVTTALASRKRRNLFLIDLSVPRNIDPQVGELDGAYLYNIDDLQEVAASNIEKRLRKSGEAEEIIEREVDAFRRRLANQAAVPTIVELRSRLEEIRSGELEKALRRLGLITAEQRQVIEALSSSIVNKILHYPIIRLKESAADEQPQDRESIRDTIRKIFGLR